MNRPTAQPPVTLYTLPGCLTCRRAKAFLSEHGVTFREVNVLTHPRSLLRLVTQARAVLPIVTVGDVTLSGFEKRQLAAVLGFKAA